MPFALAVSWLALLAALTVWIWHGVEPRVFTSPDEAVNRSAALLIRDTGSAKMPLPVDDVEDLRFMRQWDSHGDSAHSVYPPMTYVLQAGVMSIPRVRDYLVPLLPAAGMGAFCAGV